MMLELFGLAVFITMILVIYYKIKVVNAKDEEVEEILKQRMEKKFAQKDGDEPKSRAEWRRMEKEKKQQKDEDEKDEDEGNELNVPDVPNIQSMIDIDKLSKKDQKKMQKK